MKTIIGISILLATIAFSIALQAQVLETNATVGLLSITNSAATESDPLQPVIVFQDVPITTAIESLARQAEINYIIDPHLFQISGSNPEPTVTFRLENVGARDTLTRMLDLRHLAMIQDPVTTVARITRKNQPLNVVDASLLGMNTNSPASSTNDPCPLIQFQDVPLDTGLENLALQSGIDIRIDPRITAGNPTASVRWEDITAKQAIVAICQNFDLVIVKNDTTGVIQIKPKPRTEH